MYSLCIQPISPLGTHDIHVVINSLLPGQVRVTGEFVDESTAIGVLLILYAINNESDIHYCTCVITKQMEQDSISTNVIGLTGTEYGVSVFALENGLPLPSVVTSPKIVIMAARSDQGLCICTCTKNTLTRVCNHHNSSVDGVFRK